MIGNLIPGINNMDDEMRLGRWHQLACLCRYRNSHKVSPIDEEILAINGHGIGRVCLFQGGTPDRLSNSLNTYEQQ